MPIDPRDYLAQFILENQDALQEQLDADWPEFLKTLSKILTRDSTNDNLVLFDILQAIRDRPVLLKLLTDWLRATPDTGFDLLKSMVDLRGYQSSADEQVFATGDRAHLQRETLAAFVSAEQERLPDWDGNFKLDEVALTDDTTPEAFDAYPRLDAPANVAPEAEFAVVVGFRTEIDPALLDAQPIHIDNPPPGAQFMVLLRADGGTIMDSPSRPLPMQQTATVEFTCRAEPRAVAVILDVEYYYDFQLVGSAKRRVAVGASAGDTAEPVTPAPISLPPPDENVDLLVTITKMDDGRHLNWSISAQTLQRTEPVLTKIEDAREFSSKLIRDLQTRRQQGQFAASILKDAGRKIAELMPPIFFEMLVEVHEKINRPPVLLLVTEETYIPWELALLEPPLDPALPNAFLATQTHMGRWIKNPVVKTPPPGRLSLRQFTLVASKYGGLSGQTELKEAIAERNALQDFFTGLGAPVVTKEATSADMEPVIFPPQPVPDQLIHFAVHGMSNPDANDQALLLADETELLPSVFAGDYSPGRTPLFNFVFLNACQVGTAGSSLGQAAGFPGDVIRGGARGFIAPLWEVHDTPARELAEAFYAATLGNAQSAAEFLQRCRRDYDPNGSTTPMAYIYYGHPLLRLTIENREEDSDDSTD